MIIKLPINNQKLPTMTSEIYWLVPQHLIYWHMSAHITSDEICEMSHFISEQVDIDSTHKLHIIIEGNGITKIDYKSQKARDAIRILAKQRWMGKVAVFIRNYPIQVQLNSLSGAFGLNWCNVTSMQNAIRFLRQHDHQLQDIQTIRPNAKLTPITK